MLSVDVVQAKGLLLTCCSDGLIKVWNEKKELIREIKFNEPVVSAKFINNDGDIVVAHAGQLSIIKAADYEPFEKMQADPKEILRMHQLSINITCRILFIFSFSNRGKHFQALEAVR